MRLWEVEHDYYCEEGNYYKSGTVQRASSWDDFLDDMKGTDCNTSLLFRWDWEAPRGEETENGSAGPVEWKHDEYYRESTLKLFFMGQSRGAYFCHLVSVCRRDEPAIREYLEARFRHLVKLWEPFTVEVQPNALASDTFASGTDWRGNE